MSRGISKNKKEAMGMLALMLPTTLLFLVLSGMDPTTLPSASRPLPFGLPATLGNLPIAAAILYLSMGLTGLVLALLPATLSRKKTLLSGFLLLALAAFMGLFSRSPFELCCWSLLGGIGCTMNICAWISIGVTYFPRHCALVVGLMNCLAVASSIVAAKLSAIQHAFNEQGKLPLLPAMAGMLILILLYILIWHFFQQISAAGERRFIRPEARSPVGSVWSRGPLLLFLTAFCMPLSTANFDYLYSTYLREILELPIKTAQMAMGIAGISTLLSPLAGWLGDRYGAMKTLLLTLPVTAAVGGLIFLGWRMPLSVLIFQVFLMGLGLTAVFYVNMLAALIQSVAPMQNMRAAGLFYCAFNLGIPVTGVLFAYLREMLGWTMLVLVQLVFPLVLATVLVWLAQRILTPADKAVLPG
ncbi:MFS transporter [Janthinobacterium sp. EB271-G4-7A]|uniref:MFS transporter n=1 Tax=Janthinobacterium sp. EB271-G4-7A TaxID=2775056 RepID=UPI001E36231C|nr:MFS transporter [Janthinobacterium sp. EB271-G4-7A]MCC7697803.1 MFS transporter [Janthinobacterium sp. EB271-G4-7A]